MDIEEVMKRAKEDLRKAQRNLLYAEGKPHTTPLEFENLKKKVEYAGIVYAALVTLGDEKQ